MLARVKATAKALTAAVLRAAELASASSPARAWSAPAPLSHVDMQTKLHGGAIKDLGRAFRPRSDSSAGAALSAMMPTGRR